MEKRTSLVIGFALLAIALIISISFQIRSSSADFITLSIEELTEKADVILIGTVEEVFHSSAPKMYRQVTVSVERYLKNKLEADTVIVVARGATIGNITLWVEDQPEFQESERVLLFLWDNPSFLFENPQGFFEVVGMVQGKFKIGSDSAISDAGQVIEDGLRVGDTKFRLSESPFNSGLIIGGILMMTLILLLGIWARKYARVKIRNPWTPSLFFIMEMLRK